MNFGQTTVQAFTFTRQRGKRDQSDPAYPVYNECVI